MTREQLHNICVAWCVGRIKDNDLLIAVEAYSSASNDAKPRVSGSLPPVRCTTCGCTLVNNECERCDKAWNDLGNTLYEMGNEEPEW